MSMAANNHSDETTISTSNISPSSVPDIEVGQNVAPTSILISIVFSVLILVTLFGNVFVIFAIIKEKTLRKKQNILIISLAVTDLMIAVLVMPLSIVYEVGILGIVMCNIWLSLATLCCTSSILHLVAIATDRYWAVSNTKYMSERSLKRIVLMILICWISGLAIAIEPLTALGQKLNKVTVIGACLVYTNTIFEIVSLSVAFFIPAIAMTVIYFRIYKIFKRTIQNDISRRLNRNTDEQENIEHREKLRERKATITLCIITGSFITCWLPFFVLALIGHVLGNTVDIPPTVYHGFLWIGYCNSIINPVIYTVFNPDFRSAFRQICLRKCI